MDGHFRFTTIDFHLWVSINFHHHGSNIYGRFRFTTIDQTSMGISVILTTIDQTFMESENKKVIGKH
uniref:Uncharacterized protein n=1 Tax=Vitis vinifera TaxID=29760 RepID=F6GY27_VITVI